VKRLLPAAVGLPDRGPVAEERQPLVSLPRLSDPFGAEAACVRGSGVGDPSG
jgi:hypothetical protein